MQEKELERSCKLETLTNWLVGGRRGPLKELVLRLQACIALVHPYFLLAKYVAIETQWTWKGGPIFCFLKDTPLRN